ncbi:MAG TPA: YdbL family protein [Candidatus Limnocylindrales bacterium]|nr:YdbL family protein [Candidatus Limnocylindrales bacterium]
MLKRTAFILVFLVSACVTVNIYFPAAAVERAAEQIVKETWGDSSKSPPPPAPQGQNRDSPWRLVMLGLVNEAHAQEADINVSNPSIRAIKDSIKARSEAIKPFMDRGNIGIASDGLLTIRNSDGLNLKERAEIKQLVDAENRDRENLYGEIAKANNISSESIPKIKAIFAKSWLEQARPGWWIQDSQGNWRKK